MIDTFLYIVAWILVFGACYLLYHLIKIQKLVVLSDHERRLITIALENQQDLLILLEKNYPPENVSDFLKTVDEIKEKIKV
jgi:hypothetical protein